MKTSLFTMQRLESADESFTFLRKWSRRAKKDRKNGSQEEESKHFNICYNFLLMSTILQFFIIIIGALIVATFWPKSCQNVKTSPELSASNPRAGKKETKIVADSPTTADYPITTDFPVISHSLIGTQSLIVQTRTNTGSSLANCTLKGMLKIICVCNCK